MGENEKIMKIDTTGTYQECLCCLTLKSTLKLMNRKITIGKSISIFY